MPLSFTLMAKLCSRVYPLKYIEFGIVPVVAIPLPRIMGLGECIGLKPGYVIGIGVYAIFPSSSICLPERLKVFFSAQLPPPT